MPRSGAPNDGSEPPAAAMYIIVAVVVGVPVLASVLGFLGFDWRALLPWGHSGNWNIALVFAPMAVAAFAIAGVKFWQSRGARKWAQAPGRILKSGIEARHHQFSGEAETVRNEPAIEYEYSVGGETYRGGRVAFGSSDGPEAILARYPAGKSVTVYYNPAHPRDCVLERDIPKGVLSGCPLLLVLTVLGVAGIYYATTNATRLIGRYIPQPEHAPFVVAISCFGLMVLLFLLGYRRYLNQAKTWPSVSGKVIESRVDSYVKREDGRDRTIYTPVVEYLYSVHGNEYRGRQIRLGLVIEGSQALVQKTIARYPQGSAVTVHYDPVNASNATLESPGGYPWLLLGVAAFCFAAAVYASGLFR